MKLPQEFKFQDSYWQSKYSLLQYVQNLRRLSPNSADMVALLREAYCEDEETKTVLNGRFNTGDFASTPLLVQDFEYEMDALDHLRPDEKTAFEAQLKAVDCSAGT